MDDVIKGIEECRESLSKLLGNSLPLSDHHTNIYEAKECGDKIKAALSVLHKIASGDDWFDYEDCPKDGSFFLTPYKPQGVAVATYATEEACEMVAHQCPMYHPKGWKHIDQAKHVAMMIEREMQDE